VTDFSDYYILESHHRPSIQDPGDIDLSSPLFPLAYPVADLVLLFAVLEFIFQEAFTRKEQTPFIFLFAEDHSDNK